MPLGRLCVRGMACPLVFPLVRVLSSTASAAPSGDLFGRFSGTTTLSDFLWPTMIRYAFGFQISARDHLAGHHRISRFPYKEVPRVHGVFDSAGSRRHSR